MLEGAECNHNHIHLVILEQPVELYRFRYELDLRPKLGICGERSKPSAVTFPTVELRNFNGLGVIRCSLFQTNMDKPSPHPHKLVVSRVGLDDCDSKNFYVSPELGYTARFENVKVIHTYKKDIVDVLYAKKKERFKFESRRAVLTPMEENQLKYEAEKEKQMINLNQARLYFEALELGDDNIWSRIAEPVFSNIIYDYKCPDTHFLKIYHLSTATAGAAGGDEVTILTEKLNTESIKVRFFELDGDHEVWEAFGEYFDHHGYALVVRTPPYKNQDICTNVKVFIQLVCTSEGNNERGRPVSFQYISHELCICQDKCIN